MGRTLDGIFAAMSAEGVLMFWSMSTMSKEI